MGKGRRTITVNGGRKKYSHYVWYQNTGHWPIPPDEVIHHIDGNPTNNSFDNLQLMSDFEHKSLHNRGESHPMYGKRGKESPNFGKILSEEHKAKISASRMGKNNPNWKGDNATPHSKYMRIWRKRKKSVREARAIAEGLKR